MQASKSSAVVIGGSIGGLLAAQVLSSHFTRVTVLERDLLPQEAVLRKGTPHCVHGHGLLASGYDVMDRYFPGMMDDLERHGALRGDVLGDFLWHLDGLWKLRHQSGLRGIVVSRPFLEAAVRNRVRQLPNVMILDGTEAINPLYDPTIGRVTGVQARSTRTGREDTLHAALVVDASGRGSRSPAWLSEWGFGKCPVHTVRIDVSYATRFYQRRAGDLYGALGIVVSGKPPADRRSAGVLAAEGDRWIVTLMGRLGDYPPLNEHDWVKFAAHLAVPTVYNLLTSSRPLSGVMGYRFPTTERRRYERMRDFPSGYLVIGDAICSFNPIYGQGMSVAAAEALALDESLMQGMSGLAQRFFRRVSHIVDIPWTIATGEDLRYPEVEGKRSLGTGLLNRYLERVQAAASDDPVVCRKLFEVMNLLAPPSALIKPAIALRTLVRRPPHRNGSPPEIVQAFPDKDLL
jgi:2-polyprenyl-6-methoxyphenol hydroxylase-like FAD-dependent oxidoreductase